MNECVSSHKYSENNSNTNEIEHNGDALSYTQSHSDGVEDESSVEKVDRPSYRTHRSGNTFRLTGSSHAVSRPNHEAGIESDHGDYVVREDGSIEIPVTECDAIFTDFANYLQKDLSKLSYSRFWSRHSRGDTYALSKADSWKMVDYLEQNSLRTKTTSSLSGGNVETKTTYEIPVIGKLRISIPKSERATVPIQNKDSDDEKKVIKINGRNYAHDLNVIHRISGKSIGHGTRYNFADLPTGVDTIDFTIKSGGTIKDLLPERAFINIHKVWSKEENRLVPEEEKRNARYFSSARAYVGIHDYCWARPSSDKKANVILDMGANTKIKYISTMGKPLEAYCFPVKGVNAGYTKEQYANPIVVSDDSGDLNYVKRFTLHGRVDGGSWVPLGIYEGNSDRLTEKLNDVSRNTPDGYAPRYLKFTPIDIEGDGCVRFMLYGEIADLSSHGASVNDMPERITYTLVGRTEQPFSRDGCYTSCCRCEWCLGARIEQKDSMRRLKKDLNKFVKEYNADHDDSRFFGDD
ncbi:hypothetical protein YASMINEVIRUS_1330 [Yasminevirus sp. GU-2018]|uniref:Uncharacterized protein n=1 Tax=Yasminevirus sp. GU-2018 TaxID=2420051 RepID=A0A5K0U9V4_9VIRU|nr:hypothetical protein YASMINEVIRUS_1330 [Yasminevirus sp. GU-2018]